MTKEEAKEIFLNRGSVNGVFDGDKWRESCVVISDWLKQESNALQFAKWVATEIFDENWECNNGAFAELACRKLAKLGIVIRTGDEWELIEPNESEERK